MNNLTAERGREGICRKSVLSSQSKNYFESIFTQCCESIYSVSVVSIPLPNIRCFKIIILLIIENFPNLEKSMPIQMQEASRTPKRPEQNRTTPQHIIIKTTNTETQEEY
jgi:hypothetical protein